MPINQEDKKKILQRLKKFEENIQRAQNSQRINLNMAVPKDLPKILSQIGLISIESLLIVQSSINFINETDGDMAEIEQRMKDANIVMEIVFDVTIFVTELLSRLLHQENLLSLIMFVTERAPNVKQMRSQIADIDTDQMIRIMPADFDCQQP